MKLRDYQEEGKADLMEFLLKSRVQKGIFVAPVGTGKALITAVMAEMVNEPILVIQPTKELLLQNFDKAQKFGMEPTIYSAGLKSKEISDITYATPMSIVKNPEFFKKFNYVCIDESHLGLTNTVVGSRVIKKSKLAEFFEHIKPKKIIGLTATPIQLVSMGFAGSALKMMNRSARSFWNKAEIFHITQIPDVHKDYWSNITIRQLAPENNMLELNSSGSEFKEDSIIQQYDANDLMKVISEEYRSCLKKGRKSILTFVPSIKHANDLKEYLKDGSEVVSSLTPDSERDRIINDFKLGKIKHLINCMLLTAGFDHPSLDTIIMARETNSFVLYYQIFGRLVRPLMKDGKIIIQDDLFIDLTNNTNRFGDIRNITFEKHDYINGWGMFNGESLLTGYSVGNWEMPQRDYLIKKYEESKLEASRPKSMGYLKMRLPFGKYKGKTLEEVAKKDMRYLTWMYNDVDFSKPWTKELKNPIERILHEATIENK